MSVKVVYVVPFADDGCAESIAVDMCLVGMWKQNGGGAVECMRANMPPGMNIPLHRQPVPNGQVTTPAEDMAVTTPAGNGVLTMRYTCSGAMQETRQPFCRHAANGHEKTRIGATD